MGKLTLQTNTCAIDLPIVGNAITEVSIEDADLLRAVMAHYPALQKLFDMGLKELEKNARQVEGEYGQCLELVKIHQGYANSLKPQIDRLEELRSVQKLIEEGQ